MLFNIGDIVTRKSYNNDTYFVIYRLEEDTAYLKGINLRLYADSDVSDLNKVEKDNVVDGERILTHITNDLNLDRSEFFYLPGKILHIDGDEDYLKRCLTFYQKLNPDVVVITGHDAYYKRKGNKEDINNYKNTINFIEAVKQARSYEKNQDKLIVIAGACQSNYEELIKAGATFASSPKRINIHALDPAIIASYLALYDRNKTVDLLEVLNKTKSKSEGIGGVATKGCMYVGYPR